MGWPQSRRPPRAAAPLILITAATGQVGGQAARELLASGRRVRVLVRDPSRAVGLERAELVVGSFESDDAVTRAVDGVDTMLLAGRDSPEAVEQQRVVLRHATAARVRQILKLSAIGARSDSPISLMRDHDEVDEHLRASGASWTLVKPHLFLQNLLRAVPAIRRDGVLRAAMGDDRYPMIDTRDIGSVCAAILADPEAHIGATRVLTGPKAVSYGEVASVFAAVGGRAVRYQPVDADDEERRLLAAGMPAWRAFDLSHIRRAYSPTENAVTTTVETILGRPAISLDAFARDHAASWGA